MCLEPQQNKPVRKLSSILNQRRELLGLKLPRSQLAQSITQVRDQVLQILESRHCLGSILCR